MKRIKFLTALVVTIIAPVIVMADPADPGPDPYANAPVNGGIAFAVTIAFLFGVYRIYKVTKDAKGEKVKF